MSPEAICSGISNRRISVIDEGCHYKRGQRCLNKCLIWGSVCTGISCGWDWNIKYAQAAKWLASISRVSWLGWFFNVKVVVWRSNLCLLVSWALDGHNVKRLLCDKRWGILLNTRIRITYLRSPEGFEIPWNRSEIPNKHQDLFQPISSLTSPLEIVAVNDL